MKRFRRIRSEPTSVSAWWIHGGEKRIWPEYLKDPVCGLAEIRFLAFLLYLKKSGLDPKNFIFEDKTTAYNDKRSTRTQTIEKPGHVINTSKHNPGSYAFGLKTRLILTGILAGTVTDACVSIRPLFGHSGIGNLFDLIITDKINNAFYYNFVELLKVCRVLIYEKHGYVHALISALSALDIPADFEQIEQNAETMKQIALPTPDQTKQISKTHV